ncbi:MarR family winged helix-turn-helix transcriptional regulator [Rhizobium johnstonii]|uniref:MarR family winged helix-turn-helix transcriptional regulator n=1 Tax=Rhizobium TaxID=379 RepID=UPI0003FCD8C4|nr:MarR family transcriptional regulator [Rhizobium leguminosarum]MBB4504839.1 DNA-binding MarR family transcriptional regulator [Rhizobium leguminosarum]MBY5339720.1 MarR family transcriptional regulator [Rhizobium leguminosarum]MBY5386927.1 MarR family transcriptional regulator [Rhizobium leguminosarum]MBY5414411.1 MarR family transcriptional regulator [Rhizobium leguminosarum]MBY5431729.1 MarR family transcriptional regulator [Rhizobium leguminosarum]
MKDTTSDELADVPKIDEMLCFSIYSASHAFNQLYRPLLDELELTYPQFLVMTALWARDDRTVKDLGETLFLDSSTLTPLLKRLENVGLVTRNRNPADERQVLLRLTEKGLALKSRASHVFDCIGKAVGLDAEAVSKIRDTIASLRDNIHKKDKHEN